MRTWLVACALLGLCATARADSTGLRLSPAEEHARLHVYAGLFGSGYLVAAQSTDYRRGYLDHGGGGGLFAGVRLDRLLAVEIDWRTTLNGENFAAARVTNLPLDGLVVTTVSLGARVYVPTGSMLEPYGLASAGYAVIMTDFVECPDCDSVFATGPAAALGGGLDVHLGRRLSAGLRMSGQVMHFGSDSFEKRFRVVGVEPSQTQATILSLATDAYATFHF
ncbi:MAG TPA: outer membrane beta-barrel protein [Kofleriaceae bacterium]|nr:outer membrane beta-barrel protein [Kofleriaceae bacterium]